MASISVSLPSDGDTIDAADYNTPINTIVNDYNGNITNANISASAAIDGTKLAVTSVPSEQLKSTVMFRGTTTQTVTNSVSPTAITTYTEVTDRGADFGHTTGLFTAPYTGDYHFDAVAGFTNIIIARTSVTIVVNSVTVAGSFTSTAINTHDPVMSCSATVAMTAGQTAFMQVYQDSGGDIALTAPSSFSGYLIARV